MTHHDVNGDGVADYSMVHGGAAAYGAHAYTATAPTAIVAQPAMTHHDVNGDGVADYSMVHGGAYATAGHTYAAAPTVSHATYAQAYTAPAATHTVVASPTVV